MNEFAAKIESILFLSTRPVSFHKLAKMLEIKESDVLKFLEELMQFRNVENSGIHVVISDAAAELGTNPAFSETLAKMSKEETESDLTRPQLETLTIVAYRGPITKPEIEHVRGVNCSLILRNLLMRGFIVERDDDKRLQPVYALSTEMLRYLGMHEVGELPDYEKFHENSKIDALLEAVFESKDEI